MLTEALYWLRLGVSPLPVGYRSKKPILSTWAEFQDRLPTEAEVKRWFDHRHRNMAIVTGWNGLTVIDFDDHALYAAWYAWAEAQPLARLVALYTRRVTTSRGLHLYVFIDDTPRCLRVDGIDVKGKGGYVLAPPSVHPSGRPYSWAIDNAPILRVKRLEDVLPYEPEAQAHTGQATPLDPWEAANRVSTGAVSSDWAKAKAIPLLQFFPQAEKSGRGYYKAICPFHQDHEPSFWIDANRNLCNCFKCKPQQRPMSVVDFYSRLKQVDTGQAVKELSQL
jgi:hypothetical protein